MNKLVRYPLNPIIKPRKSVSWQSKAIFNCATSLYKGKIMMLTRCVGEYTKYISRIGLAQSKDGIYFRHSYKPVIYPNKDFDKWGCEDPRITEIEGTFYITYAALSKPAHKGGGPPRIALASTKDFKRYKKHGVISPNGADARDSVLLSEKINGKYVMLHRPFNWTKKDISKSGGITYLKIKEKKIRWPMSVDLPKYFPEKPSIWIGYSDDLITWYGHKVIMEPEEAWERIKIGPGPPPIKTNKGWLLIYHGVGKENNKIKYKVGAMILDLSSLQVIARTKYPIFEPKEDYETEGHVKNVVFPTGTAVIKDKLYIYYGAADTSCGLVTVRLNKILKLSKTWRI